MRPHREAWQLPPPPRASSLLRTRRGDGATAARLRWSRSQLQSINAWRVCWRGRGQSDGHRSAGGSDPPADRDPCSDSSGTRAAASSIASGLPSSRRQISTTAAASAGEGANPGSTRSPGRRTAEPHPVRQFREASPAVSAGRRPRRQLSDGTWSTAHPRRPAPRGWSRRAIRRRTGQPGRRGRRSAIRCSQLSSRMSSDFVRRKLMMVSINGPPGVLADAEASRDRLDDQLWIADRRQLDQPHAVRLLARPAPPMPAASTSSFRSRRCR